MIRNLAWACTAALLTVPGTAWAANCAKVTASPAAPAIPQWNPLNGQPQEASFTVKVSRDQGGTKTARLIFLDGNSNAMPPRITNNTGPRYEVRDAGGNLLSFPQGTQVAAANVPQIQFNNQGEASLTLKLKIMGNAAPQDDFIGGTNYAETLFYSVQCFKPNGSDNGIDNAVQSNLQVALTIPKLVSIITAGPATIDFQNFTTAEQQALIKIQSTSTLNVSATTTNSAKLMRGTSTAQNAVIPYQMRFGVSGSTLTSLPLGQVVNATRAGVVPKDYALQLWLTEGVPTGKLAGSYSDTITLTITPPQ